MPAPLPRGCQEEPSQRAMEWTTPAVVLNKLPVAMTAPLKTASSLIEVFIQLPTDCQVAPFQRATPAALTPPAARKLPPATRPLPKAPSARTGPFTTPSACQATPFQRAMLTAGTPPAVTNCPPAISSPLNTVVALTTSFIPLPSPCQAAPFQLAMFEAAPPPAAVNEPAAISSPL